MKVDLARFRPTRSALIRAVLSVTLAVLLWGWVTSLADPPDTRVATNVSVSNGIPPQGLIVSTSAPTATVTASGPESVLDDFNVSSLALTLDLSSVDGPGNYTVPVVPVDEQRFVDYRIVPATVSIVVDELVSRVFQIEVDPVGTGTTGTQIVSQQLSESEVTISGPMTLLDTIASAHVDVDVTNQTGTFESSVQVYALTDAGTSLDPRSGNITINPAYVDASIEVRTAGREVTILASVTGIPAAGYEQRTTTTNPRTVVLDGPDDVLQTLSFVETEAVDISGATGSTATSVGIANLPAGVTVVRPADGQVQVIVQIQQQGINQTLPGLDVTVTGLGEGLAATVSPPDVSLEIAAAADQLPALVSGAVSVIVDVTGLGAGTYTLTPEVSVPAGVEWDSISPAAVTVVIAPGDPSATPVATPGAGP